MLHILLLLPLTLVAADAQDYEFVPPHPGQGSARYVEQYIPQISAGLDAAKTTENFNVLFGDFSGYFFNGMIIISILLLISNLLSIPLFPALTKTLQAAGARVGEKINSFLGSKSGRALDIDTLNQMAAMVDQAVETYRRLNN